MTDNFLMMVSVPIKTVSELNVVEHWAKRAKRAKEQRALTAMVLANAAASGDITGAITLPALVTITRIAPRELDSDNLAASQKHIRDGVADWLNVDDRHHERVAYQYKQRKGKPKEYAVEVLIERKS